MKRRVIDKTQQRPADIPAALPPAPQSKPVPTLTGSSGVTREGGRARPAAPPRQIPILKSPVREQIPIQGSANVRSTLARAKRPGTIAGGAEGQIDRKRAQSAESKRDAVRSSSVIK